MVWPYYLQGLKPEIRKAIRATDTFEDITALQNACLKLDIREKGRQYERHDEALHSETVRGNYNNRGSYHRGNYYRGSYQRDNPRGSNFRGHFSNRTNYRGRTGYGPGYGRGYGRGNTQYHPYHRNRGGLQGYQGSRGGYENRQGLEAHSSSCYLCDSTEHQISRCPKLRDAKAAIQTPHQANFAGTTIIDSGATQHMFNNIDAFETDIRFHTVRVQCANEEEVVTTHIGTVNIHLENEYKFNSILPLRNTLYIPKLRHNLISVPALINDGNEIRFSHDGLVFLTDRNNYIYKLGHATSNLYHLAPMQEVHSTTSNTEKNTSCGTTDSAIPINKSSKPSPTTSSESAISRKRTK